jgi:hypothetical protein
MERHAAILDISFRDSGVPIGSTQNGYQLTPDLYAPLVIRPEDSTPVFVDATGRRRRRVRRIAYAVGVACLTYTGLVGASVIGHPARPDALAPLPAPADRPLPVVRQAQPPERPLTGVPRPDGSRPDLEAVPVRLQRHQPTERPARQQPPRAPATPLTESSPLPTPTTAPPAPTEPPTPTEPPPVPEPTGPPAPEPTDPPAPEPTEPPAPSEPPAGLPVVGPILDLLSGGSAQR